MTRKPCNQSKTKRAKHAFISPRIRSHVNEIADPYSAKAIEERKNRRKRRKDVALMATVYALDAATILLVVLTMILMFHVVAG
jgi:hypothetical protein